MRIRTRLILAFTGCGLAPLVILALFTHFSVQRENAHHANVSSSASQTVAQRVADSAAVTHEISSNMLQVDRASDHTAQGASTTRSSSQRLTVVAQELQALVAHFKTT